MWSESSTAWVVWRAWLRAVDAGDVTTDDAIARLPAAVRRLPLRWLHDPTPPVARAARSLDLTPCARADRWLERALERGVVAGLGDIRLRDASPALLSRVIEAAAGPVTVRWVQPTRVDWRALTAPVAGVEVEWPTPGALAGLLRAPGVAAARRIAIREATIDDGLTLPPGVEVLTLRGTERVALDRLVSDAAGPRALRLEARVAATLPAGWRRLDAVEVGESAALDGLDALPSMAPLRRLEVALTRETAPTLAAIDTARIEALTLRVGRVADRVSARLLARCPPLDALTLRHAHRQVPRTLATAVEAHGGRLTRLDLMRCAVDDALVERWRAAQPAPRVARLDLSDTRLSAAGLARLLDGDWLGRLDRLEVAGCSLGAPPPVDVGAPSPVQSLGLRSAWLPLEQPWRPWSAAQLPRLVRLDVGGLWMSAATAATIGAHVRRGLLGLEAPTPRRGEAEHLPLMLDPDAPLVALDLRRWPLDRAQISRVPRGVVMLGVEGAVDFAGLAALLPRLDRLSHLAVQIDDRRWVERIRDRAPPTLAHVELSGALFDGCYGVLDVGRTARPPIAPW